MSRTLRSAPRSASFNLWVWSLGVAITALLALGPVVARAYPLGASIMPRPVSPARLPFGISSPATCNWHIVTSPNAQSDKNVFNGVAATSARDAWAVGRTKNPIDGSIQPVAAHWNGTSWSLVATPIVPSANFFGVKEISSTDAWAVGTVYDQNVGQLQTLAEHWDGTSWTIVSTPNVGTSTNLFNAVVAKSTSDVWAFGFSTGTSGLRSTLTEHWNGSTWAVIPSPNISGTDNTLTSGVENSTTNVWGGGAFNCQTGSCQTLTMRWNGTKWKIIPSPNNNNLSNPINAMSSNGPTDIWAIGDWYTGSTFDTLAEHWNGTSWSIVATPNTTFTALVGSTAVNTSDVWAVGFYLSGSYYEPYSMNWNGSVWSTVYPVPTGTYGSYFTAAARIPKSVNIWAVGATFNSDSTLHLTLIEKFHC